MRNDAKVALGVAAVMLAAIIGFVLFVPSDKTTPPGGLSVRPTPAPAPVTPPVPEVTPATLPTTAPTSMPSPTTGPSDGMNTLIVSSPTAGGTPGSAGAGNPGDWNAWLAGQAAANGSGSGSRTATGNTPSFGNVNTPPSILPPPFGTTRPGYTSGSSGLDSPMGSGAETYTIKRGDTFQTIATAKYGAAKYWKLIADANPGVDSRRLKVGQSLKLPAAPTKSGTSTALPPVSTLKGPTGRTDSPSLTLGTPPATESGSTYTVVAGDSLYRISTKLYGTPSKADEIYELNKATIGSNKANLKINQVLKLPAPPTKK